MREIVIARQFRGPPSSGNGGYVCGILGKEIQGPATVALRAIIPLDTELNLNTEPGHVTLTGQDGTDPGIDETYPISVQYFIDNPTSPSELINVISTLGGTVPDQFAFNEMAYGQAAVSYTLDPAALGLSHGHHVLTLQGMLITTTAGFRS